MVDIVIPAWNNHNLTGACVMSIKQHTDVPFRIIIVDDGSDPAYEGGFPGTFDVVRLDSNSGFTAAVNAGIEFSDAEYVCVLNNDVLVTPGWLYAMLEHVYNYPNIGMLVPTQQHMGGRTCALFNDGNVVLETVRYAPAFCALFRRSTLDAVGTFDPAIGKNGVSDLDMCMKIRESGRDVAIARDVYLHHLGQCSIKLTEEWKTGEYQRVNYNELPTLRAKWGNAAVDEMLTKALVPLTRHDYAGVIK